MIKTLIKKFILYFGPWSLLRIIERRKYGAGVSILYGHRVLSDSIIANKNDPRRITGHTSVSEVESAIKELRKRFSIISMDEAISQIKSGNILKESVVLTFDDGFKDNFKYLLPVLQKHQVPATYYINSSVIETKRNLWFQSVINYFFAIKEDKVKIEVSDTEYDLSTPQKRYSAAFDFMQYLQTNYKPQEFHQVIESIAGDKALPHESDYHLNWNELKLLADDPLITIGAHSFNHYPLGYCDEELSKFEIEKSVTDLEDKLDIKINHFSYPRGHVEDFNDWHIRVLKELGISSAVTTIRGVNRKGQDLYQIKRVGFPQNISDDVEDFLWHVGGIPQLIASLRS
ncbi:MAG: polysaccharide deacetylase family protein [Kangiellaceae bacterium]